MEEHSKKQFVEILKSSGMIEEGHFVGKSSGNHFRTFINKDNLLSRPKDLAVLSKLLAVEVSESGQKIDVIAGPISGGAIMASWMAFHLTELMGRPVSAVSVDKSYLGEYSLRLNYVPLVNGKHVLLVDDVVRSGATLKKIKTAIEEKGGAVTLAAVFLDRGEEKLITVPDSPARVVSGIHFPEVGYPEVDIPPDLEQTPLNHGRPLVIGVTGRIGSGKSTFIQEIVGKFPLAEQFATGDILKETLDLWGLPRSRDLLIKLSSLLQKDIGPDVIVNEVRRRIQESQSPLILIDGVRGNKVYSLLREFKDSLLVAVTADVKMRYGRVSRRIEKPDEPSLSFKDFIKLDDKGFQKELDELEGKADVCISNNSSEADFKKQIHEFLSTLGSTHSNQL